MPAAYVGNDVSRSNRVDRDAAAAALGPDGAVALHMGRYEHRAGQVEMATAVCDALNTSKCLLVEAGTGIGKSLAYLVPAGLFALMTGERVIDENLAAMGGLYSLARGAFVGGSLVPVGGHNLLEPAVRAPTGATPAPVHAPPAVALDDVT